MANAPIKLSKTNSYTGESIIQTDNIMVSDANGNLYQFNDMYNTNYARVVKVTDANNSPYVVEELDANIMTFIEMGIDAANSKIILQDSANTPWEPGMAFFWGQTNSNMVTLEGETDNVIINGQANTVYELKDGKWSFDFCQYVGNNEWITSAIELYVPPAPVTNDLGILTDPVIWSTGGTGTFSDLAGANTADTNFDPVRRWTNRGTWGTDATLVSGATLVPDYRDNISTIANTAPAVVDFKRNTSRFTYGNVTDLNGAPGVHGFIVMASDTPSLSQYPIGAYTSGTNGNILMFTSGPPNLLMRVYTDTSTNTASGGINLGNIGTKLYMYSFSWDSTEEVLRFKQWNAGVEANAVLTGTGLRTTGSDFTIGGTESGSRDLLGPIAEVAVFNEKLSDSDETTVFNTLANRWSLELDP